MANPIFQQTKNVIRRELRRMVSRPVYLFSSVFVMFFCYVFFLTFFDEGVPRELPIGIVDHDNSYVSRTLARNVDGSSQIKIVKQYANYTEARQDMQRGVIYAIVEIGDHFESDLLSGRRPNIEYYVNDAYLIAGSLSYKELTYISELGSAYLQQRLMQAKGVVGAENQMPILQPVAIDTHLIANPYPNYGVYLLNVLLPGVLQLMIIMLTVFSIGIEIKEGTKDEWYASAGNSCVASFIGKLIPYTVLFVLLGIGGNFILYRYMHYPMNGSLLWMNLATVLYVLAHQSIGVFLIGIFPRLRDAISLGAFYGLLSFTYAGFTFPIEAMPYKAQIFAWLFPIRHYFRIYANEALNGAPIQYSFIYFAILAAFLLLPFLVYRRLGKAIRTLVN